MTLKNKSIKETFDKAVFLKNVLIGAGIALIITLVFITGEETKPDWPELWRIRPLIITPLAGAFGGAMFYLSNHVLQQAGLNKVVSVFLCSVGYLIILWLGLVLGLDGTLRN